MRTSRHIRPLTLLTGFVVAATVTAVVAATPGSRPTAPRPVAATTSSTHPYSDPIWWPVHAKVYVDCVHGNPGCGTQHTSWTMDIVQETLGGAAGDIGVYAMGAGRLHVDNPAGRPCSTANSGNSNFGTSVWIDHGGGVVSRYGHLRTGAIAVRDGSYVAAGQRIATMGTTGKGGNCGVPYLDFQVRHGGISGTPIEMKTLQVCYPSGGRSVSTWPSDLDAKAHWRPLHPKFPEPSTATYYPTWNHVPQHSVDFPAVTSACIPDTVPHTPQRPSGVSVSLAGSGRLAVHWSRTTNPAASSVQVRLAEYHTSTHAWDAAHHEQVSALSPRANTATFSGLLNGRPYRARVSFHNAAGWSASSAWVVRVPGAPPARPAPRGLYLSSTRTTTIHFKWHGSVTNGYPVRGYRVQLRRARGSGYTAWRSVSTRQTYYTFVRQPRHGHWQVRVRARNAVGTSPFLTQRISR